MQPLFQAIWGTGFRKTMTSITALCALIVAVPPAWTALGLPEIATKTFVHEIVTPIQVSQMTTTKAVNDLLLVQLEGQLYQAQQDAIKTPSVTVDQRIRDLQDQIAELKAKMAGH